MSRVTSQNVSNTVSSQKHWKISRSSESSMLTWASSHGSYNCICSQTGMKLGFLKDFSLGCNLFDNLESGTKAGEWIGAKESFLISAEGMMQWQAYLVQLWNNMLSYACLHGYHYCKLRMSLDFWVPFCGWKWKWCYRPWKLMPLSETSQSQLKVFHTSGFQDSCTSWSQILHWCWWSVFPFHLLQNNQTL